jgi:hypothetical protein
MVRGGLGKDEDVHDSVQLMLGCAVLAIAYREIRLGMDPIPADGQAEDGIGEELPPILGIRVVSREAPVLVNGTAIGWAPSIE